MGGIHGRKNPSHLGRRPEIQALGHNESYPGVTVENLWEMIPMAFPMTNGHPEFPFIAKFPVDDWIRAGAPCLTAKGWYKLCIRICGNNLDGLRHVFEVARHELGGDRFGDDIDRILREVREEPLTHFTPVVWPGADVASSESSTAVRSHTPSIIPWNWEQETNEEGFAVVRA